MLINILLEIRYINLALGIIIIIIICQDEHDNRVTRLDPIIK